jgi:hypothetical protein
LIEHVIDQWHRHLRGELPGGLDALLDEDLQAAAQALPGEASDGQGGAAAPSSSVQGAPPMGGGTGFQYTKKVLAGDTAVLEFETTIEGKYVNGVDIIRCNDAGLIVEFRVMIRPLQAVNLVHRQMGETLERMKSDG